MSSAHNHGLLVSIGTALSARLGGDVEINRIVDTEMVVREGPGGYRHFLCTDNTQGFQISCCFRRR